MVKNLIIILLILIIIVGAIMLFPYIESNKPKATPEVDPPIETFFAPIEVPTPVPTYGPYPYQAPAPARTPEPTIDPYWIPGDWGNYVYG